jgi:Tol biopolymer transport system component
VHHHHRRGAWAAGLLAATLTLPALTTGPVAAEAVGNGMIAYTRGVDAEKDGMFQGGSAEELTTDIYIQAAVPGAKATRVNAPNNKADITPSFSPDGTKIAWASNAPGSFDIMVKDLTTGVIANLTRTPRANERWPNWSSDGSSLVYNRRSGRNNLDVWIMDADGRNPRYVAGLVGPGKYAEDCCASFSADDASVVFASNRSGNFDIYRYDLNGSRSERPRHLTRLTSTKSYEGTPSVEAGGTVLYRSSNGQKMYRLDPRDRQVEPVLVPTAGMIRTPSGSPDGKKVIFGSHPAPGAQMDIAVVNARGGNQVKLTATARFSETDPTWQPLVRVR